MRSVRYLVTVRRRRRAGEAQQLSSQVRLSSRAALGLATPLVVGLIRISGRTGRSSRSAHLAGESGRGRSLAQPRAAVARGCVRGRSGLLLGAFFVTHVHAPWALVVLFGAVAVIAGLIEASLWATQGMYLLLGAILGGGLGFAGRIWQSSLCLVVGGLLVYSVARLTDRRSRRVDQRLCLANAFGASRNCLTQSGAKGSITPAVVRSWSLTRLRTSSARSGCPVTTRASLSISSSSRYSRSGSWRRI